MKLAIKRLDPKAQIPEYKTAGAAAFDINCLETKTLEPGEMHGFKTGLVFVIPKDHFLLLASRSSNGPKKGLGMVNGIGIIDSDYCGENDELLVYLQNITKAPVTVEAGERIAQPLILPAPQLEIVETLSTGAVDRGGFGSTGR